MWRCLMASRGVIFKSCTCSVAGQAGRRRNRTCPRLVERGHGNWQFDCRVRDIRGRSTQVRRGGFPSQAAATRARDGVLDQSLERFTGQRWTVERWLRYWLTTRTSIRPTTLRVYTQHIEQYLIPHLGRLRLADVTVRHLTGMFADLAKQTTRSGQPLAPATLHRICATLRGALNAAIRNDLITDNPARRVELPSRPRPHAVVWPRNASSSGGSTAPATRSPSGPPNTSPRSSTESPPTGSTRCGGSPRCAAFAGAK
ncbi:hypothetical protein [Dactylosporangium sp. NPDC005555]|uniref:hypothetical protein n=1 Tax=Dactylosporangium sp. NPDC005555 TaxID=3154889 RepID=UPI0033BE0C09